MIRQNKTLHSWCGTDPVMEQHSRGAAAVPLQRVWIVSIHHTGHITPLVSLVSELQRLHYQCVVVSNDPAAPKLAELLPPLGARFLSLGLHFRTEAEDAAATKQFFSPAARLFPATRFFADLVCGMERNMCAGLWRLLGPGSPEPRPHLIICDAATVAGLDAAESFCIPAVAVSQSNLSGTLEFMGQNKYNLLAGVPVEQQAFVFSAHMSRLQRWLLNPLLKRLGTLPMALLGTPRRDAVRAEFGLPRLANRTLFAAPRLPRGFLMLVGTSWALEIPRPLPCGWHLCGPLAADFTRPPPPVGDPVCRAFCDGALVAGRPLVLVAFGSIVRPTPGHVSVLEDAMRQLPDLHFLWSLPDECRRPADLGPLPDNVLCLPWVPQVPVLFHPACRLFVTHCGMGSAHEGAAAGVPLLAVPYGADQLVNAQHVEDQGRGMQMKPHQLRVPALLSAVRTALTSRPMQVACAETARALCSQSGPRTAALLIDGFVKGRAAEGTRVAAGC